MTAGRAGNSNAPQIYVRGSESERGGKGCAAVGEREGGGGGGGAFSQDIASLLVCFGYQELLLILCRY